MERLFRRTACKAAASAFLLISLTVASQPGFAQYTSGHMAHGAVSISKNTAPPPLFNATMGDLGPTELPAMQGTADPEPPCLQGATMGTIGPQGQDGTYVTGVNTAGTVRVNMLAMLEALLNVVAGGAELITVLWGSVLLLTALLFMAKQHNGLKRCLVSMGLTASFLFTGLGVLTSLLNCVAFAADSPWQRKDRVQLDFWVGLLVIKAGLAIPFAVNWLIVSARDANLFS